MGSTRSPPHRARCRSIPIHHSSSRVLCSSSCPCTSLCCSNCSRSIGCTSCCCSRSIGSNFDQEEINSTTFYPSPTKPWDTRTMFTYLLISSADYQLHTDRHFICSSCQWNQSNLLSVFIAPTATTHFSCYPCLSTFLATCHFWLIQSQVNWRSLHFQWPIKHPLFGWESKNKKFSPHMFRVLLFFKSSSGRIYQSTCLSPPLCLYYVDYLLNFLDTSLWLNQRLQESRTRSKRSFRQQVQRFSDRWTS